MESFTHFLEGQISDSGNSQIITLRIAAKIQIILDFFSFEFFQTQFQVLYQNKILRLRNVIVANIF